MRRNRAFFLIASLVATLAITIFACTGDDPVIALGHDSSDGGGVIEGGPAALTLSFEPMTVSGLAPGGSTAVKVKAVRAAGVMGSVKLTLTDPAGEVSAPSIDIAANDDLGTLTLAASPTAKLGAHATKITAVVAAFTVDASFGVTVGSAPGTFDPTFADGGIVYLSSPVPSGGQTLHGLTLGDGGVLYAVGEVASTAGPPTDLELIALEASGELVRTFGGAGRATYGVGGPQVMQAVTTLADGTILSAGWTPELSTSSPMVTTQNAKGELTPAGDGLHILDGGGPGAFAYAVASDGTNRYLGGLERGGQVGNRMRVWKVTPLNEIDSTFPGTISTPIVVGGFPGLVTDLMVEPDGRILVVANARFGSAQFDVFVAARLTNAGAADPTFGDGGVFVQTLPSGADIGFESIARQGTTLIVVASLKGPSSRDIGVFRVDANGHALDATFGTAGKVLVDVDGVDDRAIDVAVDKVGRIVIVGSRNVGGAEEGFVLRLRADGTRDSTFGTNGVVKLPADRGGIAESIVIQPDGRLVVAGTTSANAGAFTMGFVARLLP